MAENLIERYLSDLAEIRGTRANVPETSLWNYTIGGYQVIKKWLSYREKPLLGRSLTPEEVRHITETARRLTALLTLHPRLDENYRTAVSS